MNFKKAPLVELIAEVRWTPLSQELGSFSAGANPLVNMVPPGYDDPLFSHFSEAITLKGFGRSEKLTPPGFPTVVHQPIYRFRKTVGEDSGSPIYQLGSGIFSVHAVPPYREWAEFEPAIRNGLAALVDARGIQGPLKFTSVKVRYINNFGPPLLKGLKPRQFLENVFKIKIGLPGALAGQIKDQDAVVPSVFLQFPLKSGLEMTFSFNPPSPFPTAEDSIVTDSIVSTGSDYPRLETPEEVMKILNRAHTSIEEVFLGLTREIHESMEPN